MNYRPEIDGLRAVAVIPVILFHLGYQWIDGGYLGVDIFFVISGYLITSILVTDISSGNFNMFEFWKRRVKRLLPALLVVLLFFLLIYPFALFKPNIKAATYDINPAIFSYFNFHALIQFGDYWGYKADNSFFLHTWSLSLEEQFYLIYPLFLLFSYKYFKKSIIPLVVITLTSFLIYIILISKNQTYAFYLLPSRLWELSVGGIFSLINLNLVIKNKIFKASILYIGFLLIITGYLIPSFSNLTLTISTFLAVIGALVILSFCNQSDYLGKALSIKPLVYLGKISYSLYLWHWPIIVLFSVFSWQLSQYNKYYIDLLIFSLTLLISVLSYHFIENKTRKGKHTIKLVVGLIIITVSVSSYYKSNHFNVYYNSQFNQVKYYLRYFDISPKQVDLKPYNTLIHNVYLPKRQSKHANAYKEGGIKTIIKSKVPELILFGDSHGVMWGKLINDICDSLAISRSCYTSNAVNPFFNLKNINEQEENNYYSKEEKNNYAKSLIQKIEKWKPKIFIIACMWENYANKEDLLNLLDYLKSKSIKVIIFNQPPRLDFIGDNNASQYFTYLGFHPTKDLQLIKTPNNKLVKEENNKIKRLKKKYENLEVYDVYSKMIKDEETIISNGKEIYYFDDDHLTYEGTKYHRKNIIKLLTASFNQ